MPPQSPLAADIMSGPGAPVSKALLWCGWRVLPIDILLDPTHDLSDATRQALLHEQLMEADCIMAALDCSTKWLERYHCTSAMADPALSRCAPMTTQRAYQG